MTSAFARSFVSTLLATLLVAGCKVYDPSLLEGGQCEGRRPPPRPMVADGNDTAEVYFGLRDVVLDQQADGLWARVGFNLDGYCTGSPDWENGCQPIARARPQADGDDGIDNTFGKELFPLVDSVVPGLNETARMSQLKGVGLPILRVRGWNGTRNDPRIHVTITQAVGSVAGNDDGSKPDVVFENHEPRLPNGEPAPEPLWDGNDYTWVRSDTFLAGNPDDPLVYDNNAYVADGVFVMHLPDRVEILFPADDVGVMVRLTGGIATGRLSEDGMRLEDVVVAGRWSIIDLLRTAENVGLCMGTPQYAVLRSRLEAVADVTSEVDPGPGAECDAISIGVGFTGFRMKFGGVTEGRPLASVCDDQGAADGGTNPDEDAGMSTMDGGV